MSRKARLLRAAAGVALVLTLAGVVTPTYGYRMIQNFSVGRVTSGLPVSCANLLGFAHWLTNETHWYNNTSGQGAGKTAALIDAMNTWTSVSTATQVLTYQGTTGAGFTTDGQNTISWGTGQGCGTGCLALTALVLLPGQIIIESDITFNASATWTTNGTNYDTQSVATHELGHALGTTTPTRPPSFRSPRCTSPIRIPGCAVSRATTRQPSIASTRCTSSSPTHPWTTPSRPRRTACG